MSHRSFHEANASVPMTDVRFRYGSDVWIIGTPHEGGVPPGPVGPLASSLRIVFARFWRFTMKITVLGSGDTRGLPKIGCACPTCIDAKTTGFERKRFGLIVEHQGARLLVDASPDLRTQLLKHQLSPSDFDALLLTHEHFDHVAGLGEFFSTGKALPVFGLSGTLSRVFSETNYGYLLKSGCFQLFPTEFFKSFLISAFYLFSLPI